VGLETQNRRPNTKYWDRTKNRNYRLRLSLKSLKNLKSLKSFKSLKIFKSQNFFLDEAFGFIGYAGLNPAYKIKIKVKIKRF
jgi:hypothetical protein